MAPSHRQLPPTEVWLVGPLGPARARLARALAAALRGTTLVHSAGLDEAVPPAMPCGRAITVVFAPALDPSATNAITRLLEAAPDRPVLVVGDGDEAAAARVVAAGAQDCLSIAGATVARLTRAMTCAWQRAADAARLRSTALADPLTGLVNRVGLDDRLAHALAAARRRRQALAVLFLDLDGFKAVNDLHGHAVGDAVLQALAARLAARTRGTDTVARLGGDEFVVVVEDLDEPGALAALAAKLQAALCEPVVHGGAVLTVSASIGISVYPQDGVTGADLLRHADAAMYAAKAEGKRTFRFCSPALHADANARRVADLALQQAMADGTLALDLQPRWDTAAGRVVACDTVVRWRRPASVRTLEAADVSAVADRAGLAAPLAAWSLQAAVDAAVRLRAGGFALPVTVALTARQLATPGLVAAFAPHLRAARLPAGALQVRVAARTIADGQVAVLAALGELRRLDVGVIVDGVDAACPLGALTAVEADAIALDAALVQRMRGEAGDRAVAAAIVALGRRLGRRVIAAGVDTPELAARLAAEGCGELRGAYWADPLPLADLIKYLRWSCTATPPPATDVRRRTRHVVPAEVFLSAARSRARGAATAVARSRGRTVG